MKKSLSYLIFTLFVFFVVSTANSQDTLEVSQYEMNHCVQLHSPNNSVVISSREGLDSLIRHDASRDYCMELLEDFDIDRFSLLGIDIHSGYCRIPSGLAYSVVQFSDEKKYVFEISYHEPSVPCPAFSSYHLWLKVPKLVDGYEVEFVVEER